MIQVGSVAVFVLRHKNLVGGGKGDLLHIAHVIALNMVSVFIPCVSSAESFLVSKLGDWASSELNDAIPSKAHWIDLSLII